MTDFSKPVVTDNYAALLPGVKTALNDLARALEPTLTGAHSNVPEGAQRWNAALARRERYDGAAWAPLRVNNYPSVRPSLLLDLSNSKKLDPRITFSRASTATYFDANGVLQTAAANVPRFEHDPLTGECLGLLVEEQRTNLLTYSEQFDHVIWSRYGAGTGVAPTVTANYASAPDGTTTADRIQFNKGAGTSSGDYSLIDAVVGLASGVTAKSVWLKSNTGANQQVLFSDGAESIGAVVTVTPVWQRFELGGGQAYTVSNLTLGCRAGADAGAWYNGGDQVLDILVWGAQIEAGSFSTSYIKTTGAAATRAADAATLALSGALLNPAAGTLLTDLYLPSPFHNQALPSPYRAAAPNTDSLAFVEVDTIGVRCVAKSGGVAAADLSVSNLPASPAIRRYALAWAVNDFALSAHGSAPTSPASADTSGAVPVGMDTLALTAGQITDLQNSFGRQYLRRLALYPQRLANATLQALTTL